MTFRQFESYTSGMCDAYAIALHRIHGWPLAVIRGHFKEDDEWQYEDAHAIAIPQKGMAADCKGIRTQQQMKKECFFSNPVTKVTVEIVTEEEMKYLFTIEGVSEEQIQQAMAAIK